MKKKSLIAVMAALVMLTGCGGKETLVNNQDNQQDTVSNENENTDNVSKEDSATDDDTTTESDTAEDDTAIEDETSMDNADTSLIEKLDTSKFDSTKMPSELMLTGTGNTLKLPASGWSVFRDMGYRLDASLEVADTMMNEVHTPSESAWGMYGLGGECLWYDDAESGEPADTYWCIDFPLMSSESATVQDYLDEDCFMLTGGCSMIAVFPMNPEDYVAEPTDPEILLEILGQPSEVLNYSETFSPDEYCILLAYEYEDFTMAFEVTRIPELSDAPFVRSSFYFSKKGWEAYRERRSVALDEYTCAVVPLEF